MNMTINTNYRNEFKILQQTKDRVISESKNQESSGKESSAATVNISLEGIKQYKDSIKPEQGILT